MDLKETIKKNITSILEDYLNSRDLECLRETIESENTDNEKSLAILDDLKTHIQYGKN